MPRTATKAALAAGLIGLGLAGAAAARDWGPEAGRWGGFGPADRAAFADARIAALHAGLRLTPEQEKLWPAVETALRDMASLRERSRTALRDRPSFESDAPGALRAMADAAGARADALRKLADATQPLYAGLDPDQKRRAMILARPIGAMGGPGRWGGSGFHRGERGPDREER